MRRPIIEDSEARCERECAERVRAIDAEDATDPLTPDDVLIQIAEDNPKAEPAQLLKLLRREYRARISFKSDEYEVMFDEMLATWFWGKYASVLKTSRGRRARK